MGVMRTITVYQCEICGSRSENKRTTAACERRGRPVPVAVAGDIVLARAGYGWYDGDRAWIENYDAIGPMVSPGHARRRQFPQHGNCFGSCCTYQFYYVVTCVEPDPDDAHRWRYHLATRAMSGKSGRAHGWTHDDGSHYTPRKVDPQPHLDVSGLLGTRSELLL